MPRAAASAASTPAVPAAATTPATTAALAASTVTRPGTAASVAAIVPVAYSPPTARTPRTIAATCPSWTPDSASFGVSSMQPPGVGQCEVSTDPVTAAPTAATSAASAGTSQAV